ncbi:hypothetical protein PF006_g19137 [Phytophthora fragariae]|uniref:Uncharacterized protein n=2 Tax=Phytophthora fragariae TaxID=53985 RepID=A0A6A3SG43_9STRA|nr:hypothetical protein PF006_g19137 [Phytophthora fragariae]
MSGMTASVRPQAPPHLNVEVAASTIRLRQVLPDEYGTGAPGEWLRKAAIGVSDGLYVTGQVIVFNGSEATLRTLRGEFHCRTADLVEVSPVLFFLTGKQQPRTADMTVEELVEQNTGILDRLLGTTQRGSCSIPRVLAGYMPARQQPQPTDTIEWINALSGVETTVGVRHAVDYVHFIDGNRRLTASVRDTIGDRFDAEPRFAGDQTESPTNDDVTDQADLEELLASIGGEVAHTLTPLTPRPAPPASTNASGAQDNHAKILAAVADDPELIRFYLRLSQSVTGKRSAPSEEPRETQRRRIHSASDLLDISEPTERRSKHAFVPTRTQQLINGLISAPDYAGNDPSAVVDIMISSRSTKLEPHPAIIARVYDIQFGARGLSIMPFWRFDFATRRAWYANGSVNLSNFSASVAMPKARKPQSLDDISNALTVLHVFAEEFFDQHTCWLVSSAREFVEELRSFCKWTPQDVGTLTFWFDRLFEDYRTATESDARHSTSLRTEIRQRLSLQDPDLQSVLYIIQSERLASLAPTRAARTQSPIRGNGPRRVEASRVTRKIPQEVLDALPRQGRLSVCMKHLSARGCVSKSDDRCAFPNHAHFFPDELAPVVRNYITTQLGGLRDELQQ